MDLIISGDGTLTLTKYNPCYYGIEWTPLFDHRTRKCKSKFFGEYRMYKMPPQMQDHKMIRHTDLERLRKSFDFFFGFFFLKNPTYPVKIHFTGKPGKSDKYLFNLMFRLSKFSEIPDEFWKVKMEYRVDLFDKTALLRYEPLPDLVPMPMFQQQPQQQTVVFPTPDPFPNVLHLTCNETLPPYTTEEAELLLPLLDHQDIDINDPDNCTLGQQIANMDDSFFQYDLLQQSFVGHDLLQEIS